MGGVAVVMCVHDDCLYLEHALSSCGLLPKLVFVSKLSWNGEPGDWEFSKRIAESCGAKVIVGEWTSELEHRKAAYQEARKRGYRYALILDSDEVLVDQLLDSLVKIAEAELADRVYVSWDTYWKSPEFVIRPREPFTPCILINLEIAHPVRLRDFEGGRPLYLPPEHGIIHHLSYSGPDERIHKKITSWGHKDEVQPNWWDRVWKQWDSNRLMENIHPTHPEAYRVARHIEVPPILQGVAYENRELEPLRINPPKPDIVIPAYGGQEDLTRCLFSLETCKHLIGKVIVIDNGSHPALKTPKWVTRLQNGENIGFARACNQGFEASNSEIVLFLNSDTVVHPDSLLRLMEPFEDETASATGPYTNNSGHFQKLDLPCASGKEYELLAQDFARRPQADRDVDMLVGFCLAIRKAALGEELPFDERFGLGTFEDNDLCYRLRRKGHRLILASRSFIYHEGSKTFSKLEAEEKAFRTEQLLDQNLHKYISKWKGDLDSGYASHLSGLTGEPIQFEPLRAPELQATQIAELKEQADITLCMIVKNEERVIRDCLESVKPFFKEIHVLDTGSTDATVQIAKECGAKVGHFDWINDFSAARTKSMAAAKSRWIMWMDADDTLPHECGKAILRAAIDAPEDIIGFVIPVKFVESSGTGTEVDHVKLIRNVPGLTWEGRIHEQILPSLRRQTKKAAIKNGKIARLDAYVLHSGYDTSDEGQARKRERDSTLLKLDLEDRPNHPFVLFNLGMTAHFTGAPEEAISWLEKCLEYSPKTDSHVRKAYALLAASYRQIGSDSEAKRVLEKGATQFSDDPEIHFHLAQIAAAKSNHKEAVRLYEKVLRSDVSGIFTSLDPGILGYKTRHNLALSLLALGKYEEAKSQWLIAVTESGCRQEIAYALFEAAIQNKDLPTCEHLIELTEKNCGRGETWSKMLQTLAEQAGAQILHVFEEELAKNPNNLHARRSLALVLLNSGRTEEATTQLHILSSSGLPEGPYFLGVLAENSGRVDEARNWYERANMLGPGHEATLESLRRVNQ